LALGVVVGNFLAAIGTAIGLGWEWRLDYVLANIFHDVGEVLAVGSDLILLVVCLVMLGVGVRGALRPATAKAS
jgi:SNF family Na+-dependent transporter